VADVKAVLKETGTTDHEVSHSTTLEIFLRSFIDTSS